MKIWFSFFIALLSVTEILNILDRLREKATWKEVIMILGAFLQMALNGVMITLILEK